MEVLLGLVFLFILGAAGIAALMAVGGFRTVQQYERGVVFRLGRVQSKVRGPGLCWVFTSVEKLVKVNMQIRTMPVPSQQIITRDNVSIDVAAVAYFRVVDPIRSLIAIEDIDTAISQIAQTTVRNIVGQSTLDEVLSETDRINAGVKVILDRQTEEWGAEVTVVELKDIRLPESMQRAMARQAEAEREKRGKVIAAEGEELSAEKLGNAADIIAAHPIALQLRNLQVLGEIAAEKNSTIVFPSQFLNSWKDIQEFMAREVGSSK